MGHGTAAVLHSTWNILWKGGLCAMMPLIKANNPQQDKQVARHPPRTKKGHVPLEK